MGKFSVIDDFDRKILRHVQRNNLLTSAQLSDLVGLSPSSVQRRLNKLRADRVIEADIAVISPTALERPLTMLVAVELARERSDIIDRFKRAVRERAEVMSAYYVTGETDFMLIVSAKDMSDYEAFTRDFFYNNADIKGFKTTVVMDRIKASFSLPI
ncbi:Lrp/AsnC family transcriptional regulator [Cypionkella sp.]|jgi:Lrp/AsnC family transcriptional regulator, leucine-responsive regulatory protein|uniref:Lrp/AsnC family transcriptional regulator n=1 Tax=Cypionkella sp. TaxID=2811411 RepID=UPI00276C598E|nr:Lrp/AsnC family transcriptional regulator [Cypionkella sp.]